VGFARWRFVSPRLVPVNITGVMVAVDGSDHSKIAAELGIRLATLWNAQLYFIHVREEDKIASLQYAIDHTWALYAKGYAHT